MTTTQIHHKRHRNTADQSQQLVHIGSHIGFIVGSPHTSDDCRYHDHGRHHHRPPLHARFQQITWLMVFSCLLTITLVGCSQTKQAPSSTPDRSTTTSPQTHPDYTQAPQLVDTRTGQTVDITSFQSEANTSQAFTVLHFLLKTECPICLRHTWAYHNAENEYPAFKHLYIKPDSIDEIQAWLKDADSSAPHIYQDPNAQLAEFAQIPDGYAFHGESVHYPAFIVIDRAGKEVFRHIGQGTTDRFGLKRFEQLAQQLTQP